MKTLTQTQWNRESSWFKRTINRAKMVANSTYIVGKVATVAVATIAVSSVKVVTGAFGTSRFSRNTNRLARDERASLSKWLKYALIFEVAYLSLVALKAVLVGGSVATVAAWAGAAFLQAMVMAIFVGIVAEISIVVITSLYNSIVK